MYWGGGVEHLTFKGGVGDFEKRYSANIFVPKKCMHMTTAEKN